ncbi:MAG: hypothetical protein GY811_14870 [Myxococcales bacterium]|nr:hypothetical protein [Myxococcales bacterium]
MRVQYTSEMTTPGTSFAGAFLEKKFDLAGSVFAEEAPFMISTPGQLWEAAGPSGVVGILSQFLGDDETIEIISILEYQGRLARSLRVPILYG